MRNTTNTVIDSFEIEREARRLRAKWISSLFGRGDATTSAKK